MARAHGGAGGGPGFGEPRCDTQVPPALVGQGTRPMSPGRSWAIGAARRLHPPSCFPELGPRSALPAQPVVTPKKKGKKKEKKKRKGNDTIPRPVSRFLPPGRAWVCSKLPSPPLLLTALVKQGQETREQMRTSPLFSPKPHLSLCPFGILFVPFAPRHVCCSGCAGAGGPWPRCQCHPVPPPAVPQPLCSVTKVPLCAGPFITKGTHPGAPDELKSSPPNSPKPSQAALYPSACSCSTSSASSSSPSPSASSRLSRAGARFAAGAGELRWSRDQNLPRAHPACSAFA